MRTENGNNGTTEFLNFSAALNHLRWGDKIARRVWQPGIYLKVDYHGRAAPRIMVHDPAMVPGVWAGPSGAILAEDWYVV
jgi:hypothetical protein